MSNGSKHLNVSDKIYNYKIVKCGENIEIYKYQGCIIKAKRKLSKPIKRVDKTVEEKFLERRKNLNKSRNKIARLVKSNLDLKTFITLTFAVEPTIEKSKKMLNIFFTKLRKKYPDLKYIWVMERGEQKGRLHYHLLTNIDFGIICTNSKHQAQKDLEVSFAKNLWCHGYVDIKTLNIGSMYNIAGYLSYYITKSMLNIELVNQRIFSCSRNLEKPKITTFLTSGIEEKNLIFTDDSMKLKYSSNYNCFGKKNVSYYSYTPNIIEDNNIELLKKE